MAVCSFLYLGWSSGKGCGRVEPFNCFVCKMMIWSWKCLKIQLAEKCHVAAPTGEASPSDQWFRLLGQGQYNNGKRVLASWELWMNTPRLQQNLLPYICFWITSNIKYLVNIYLLNRRHQFISEQTFLNTDAGHCKSW